jgi:hypothetical protein
MLAEPALSGEPESLRIEHQTQDLVLDRRGSSSCLLCLIIRLIIQTIRQDPSGSVWIDDPSNVSRPVPSGADQIDAEHQATDLAVGRESGCCDVEFDHQGAMVADGRGDHPGPAGPDRPGWIVAQDMVQLLGGGGIGPGAAPPRSRANPAGRRTAARLRACSGRPPAAAAPPGIRPPAAAPAAGGRCGLGGWTDGWLPP